VAGSTMLFGILDIFFEHTHQRHVFLLAAATVRVEK
jgi:hypothetical protein